MSDETDPCSVEPASQWRIVKQICESLDNDKGKVALLLTEEHLLIIITALRRSQHSKAPEFVASLEQLFALTFGKKS